MRKLRIYVDTSVFGGVVDDEFAEATRRFLDWAKRAENVLLVSPEVVRELGGAPPAVHEAFDSIPQRLLSRILLDADVTGLAEAYIAAEVLGRSAESDALHVAAATVAEADLVVSWNFRHMVSFERVRKFNAVNALHGYRPIDIRSPLEVGHEDDEQDV